MRNVSGEHSRQASKLFTIGILSAIVRVFTNDKIDSLTYSVRLYDLKIQNYHTCP